MDWEWLGLFDADSASKLMDAIAQSGLAEASISFDQVTNLLMDAGIDPATLTDQQVDALTAATGDGSTATRAEHASAVKFGGGCDCGFNPGNCGSGSFCRWT